MRRNALTAALAALTALAVTAPVASADNTACPPGVSDAQYCASHNESGVETKGKGKTETEKSDDKTVKVHITCDKHPGCDGTIVLEGPAAKSSAAHAAAASVVYGTASYSLKFGESANVSVPLTAAGVRAIQQTGTLSATVAAVSNGVRSVIGHIKVKGHKAAKKHGKRRKGQHSTHATGRPGFTG